MQLFHHHHSFSLHRILHSDFWLFELSVWLHVVGRSLIAVFIPILLLSVGYSVGNVMLYYFIYCLFNVPLHFPVRWLIRKIGARVVIVLGILSSIGFFAVLFNLTVDNWRMLVLLAVFAALYDVLYWVGHIYFFMESSKKRESATKDTSTFFIVKRVGGMLAPAIGAAILILFDQKVLIAASIAILFISIWPLVKMKNVEDKPTSKQLPARKFFNSWDVARDYFTMGLFSIHGLAEGIMWPVFIFMLFESVQSVAVIPIIVSLTTVVFTYFAGRVKQRDRGNAVVLGSLLIGIIWIVRLAIESNLFYFASIFLIGLFSVLVMIPMDSGIYEKGENRDPLSTSMYRNFFAMITKLVVFGALALLVNVFQVSFTVAATAMFVLFAVMFLFKGSVDKGVESKEMTQV